MEVDEHQNREGDKNNEINNIYNGDYIYLFWVYFLRGHIVGMDGKIKINIIKYISTIFAGKMTLDRRVFMV